MSAGQAFAFMVIGAIAVIVIAIAATSGGNWRNR